MGGRENRGWRGSVGDSGGWRWGARQDIRGQRDNIFVESDCGRDNIFVVRATRYSWKTRVSRKDGTGSVAGFMAVSIAGNQTVTFKILLRCASSQRSSRSRHEAGATSGRAADWLPGRVLEYQGMFFAGLNTKFGPFMAILNDRYGPHVVDDAGAKMDFLA